MKSFRTEVDLSKSSESIQHNTPILTIGSCFSDSIGQLLQANKFKVSSNPLGTLYNPSSIHKALSYVIHNELPLPLTYFPHQAIWNNFDFHSSFSARTRGEIEKKVSNEIGTSHHFLKNAKHLFITYGTARVHRKKDTDELVANCHKLPSTNFTTQFLTPESIVDSFRQVALDLKAWNPNLRITLTVSPVRHIKETLESNSVSKSILRWSCRLIEEQFEQVDYFPAFEIMMDDLRDYRFYGPDMIHPSEEAIQYIWDKFSSRYFDNTTQRLVERWQVVAKAVSHRPFHPEGPEHQKFLHQTLERLMELTPTLDVVEEITTIQSQLLLPS